MSAPGFALHGSPAFRDLGGLPTRDGRRIAQRRLFRADALHSVALDPDGLLHRLQLRLACDLRGADERQFAQCLHWLDPPPRSLHLELSADIAEAAAPLVRRMVSAADADAALSLMLLTYSAMPRAAAAKLGPLFEALASGEWPALVHCTAGKDRTGFTIATILSAVGVAPEVVYADYLLGSRRDPLEDDSPSSRFFGQLLGRKLTPEEAAIVHGVRREYLDAAMATVGREWGGMDNYLRAAVGLDDSLLRALREQLLDAT